MSGPLGPRDLSRPVEQLTELDPSALPPLPHPYADWENPALKPHCAASRAGDPQFHCERGLSHRHRRRLDRITRP